MLNAFGVEKQKIISENRRVSGRITAVKNCRWLKVNKKPVRTHAMDGAVFPHIVHFVYHVNGLEYRGSKFINHNSHYPHEDEKITIFYDKDNPQKYVVDF